MCVYIYKSQSCIYTYIYIICIYIYIHIYDYSPSLFLSPQNRTCPATARSCASPRARGFPTRAWACLTPPRRWWCERGSRTCASIWYVPLFKFPFFQRFKCPFWLSLCWRKSEGLMWPDLQECGWLWRFSRICVWTSFHSWFSNIRMPQRDPQRLPVSIQTLEFKHWPFWNFECVDATTAPEPSREQRDPQHVPPQRAVLRARLDLRRGVLCREWCV